MYRLQRLGPKTSCSREHVASPVTTTLPSSATTRLVAEGHPALIFEPDDGLLHIVIMPGADGIFVITGPSNTGMTSGSVGVPVRTHLVLGETLP